MDEFGHDWSVTVLFIFSHSCPKNIVRIKCKKKCKKTTFIQNYQHAIESKVEKYVAKCVKA